jgi:hypothetical protein
LARWAIGTSSAAAILLVDGPQDHNRSGWPGEEEEHAGVDLAQDPTFVPDLEELADRADIDRLAVRGIILPGQLPDLAGEMVVLVLFRKALASSKT